jgi:hypothetical protein
MNKRVIKNVSFVELEIPDGWRLLSVAELKGMKNLPLDNYMSSEFLGNDYVYYMGFNKNEREVRHTYLNHSLTAILIKQ